LKTLKPILTAKNWIGRKYGKMSFIDLALGVGDAVVLANDEKLKFSGFFSITLSKTDKYGLELNFKVFKGKSETEEFTLRNPSKYNRVEIYVPVKNIEEAIKMFQSIVKNLERLKI